MLTREIENLHILASELETRLPHVKVIRELHFGTGSPRTFAALKSFLKRVLIPFRKLWLSCFPGMTPATSPLPERPYYPFMPLPSACIKKILNQRHWADLIQAEFHETLFTSFLPLGGIPLLFVCHQAHALFCHRFYYQHKSFDSDGSSQVLPDLLNCLSVADTQAASLLETNLLRGFHRVITFTQEDREALLGADPGLSIDVSPFPLPSDIHPVSPNSIKHWRKRLVFIGPGYWHPNVEAVTWFCEEVRPLLLEHFL